MSRMSKKWLPALVVPAVIVAVAVAMPMQANAVVDLPDKTPSQVLQMISQDETLAFSGAVTKTADLGFAALNLSTGMTDSMAKSAKDMVPKGMEDFVPKAADSKQLAAALELLSGTQTARIYVDGATKMRVQILDRMAERDLVRNGNKIWLYNSNDATVTYAELPKMPETLSQDEKDAAQAKLQQYLQLLAIDVSTPAKAADYLLSQLDSSTKVSVGSDAKVAGRSVYQLILEPRAAESLINRIVIAIDSETGLPLDLTVLSKQQKAAAFEVGFTSIDFAKPSADIFNFATPAGAKVTTVPMPTEADMAKAKAEFDAKKAELQKLDLTSGLDGLKAQVLAQLKKAGLADISEADLPFVTGNTWTTVIELPASLIPAGILDNDTFSNLTTKVAGGRVISTSLVNVLITDSGRIFAGSVTVESLLATASK